MSSSRMTIDRFRELATAYGARLDRWPESERKNASRLLASSPVAMEIFRQEQALDRQLSLSEAPVLSAAFERRLAELPLRSPQHSLSLFRRWLWAPLLGWSVAAALGLVLGASLGDSHETDTSAQAAALTTDEGLEALALGDVADWEEGAR